MSAIQFDTEALAAAIAQAVVAAVVPLLADVSASQPAKTTKAPAKEAPKPASTKALTKKTRAAFIKAAAKDGYECEGYSTWDLAYWAVSIDYAPKGFHVGERYTEMALEAGA